MEVTGLEVLVQVAHYTAYCIAVYSMVLYVKRKITHCKCEHCGCDKLCH